MNFRLAFLARHYRSQKVGRTSIELLSTSKVVGLAQRFARTRRPRFSSQLAKKPQAPPAELGALGETATANEVWKRGGCSPFIVSPIRGRFH